MVRENGVKTYFASDIAYVFNKLERGFDHLLYIWGADHHGYITRLRAGLVALGGPAESFEVRLVQFVSLFRGGEKAQMSTRSGEFVTLRDLRKEVGNDAARLFYVMRSNDQHLDFDMELATARSNDNPVYYIQYAHARVASVMRQLQERGLTHDAAHGCASLGKLAEPQELQLIKRLGAFPEIVRQCAAQRAPHTLVHYLRDLANDFHTNYSAHQFIVEDAGPARRSAHPGPGGANRDPQRARTVGRIRARDDVELGWPATTKPNAASARASPDGWASCAAWPLGLAVAGIVYIKDHRPDAPLVQTGKAEKRRVARQRTSRYRSRGFGQPKSRRNPTTSTTCCRNSRWWCRRRTRT